MTSNNIFQGTWSLESYVCEKSCSIYIILLWLSSIFFLYFHLFFFLFILNKLWDFAWGQMSNMFFFIHTRSSRFTRTAGQMHVHAEMHIIAWVLGEESAHMIKELGEIREEAREENLKSKNVFSSIVYLVSVHGQASRQAARIFIS